MKPLVSILIPTYNARNWVEDTLLCAIEQTWNRKEIIVVDDGSKDATLRVVERFRNRGVQVYSQRNQGAAAARNRAFSLCSGDYIQWLDADDLMSPDKIAKQMEVLEQCRSKRILASSGWGQFLYRPSRAKFMPTSLWEDLPPTDWLVRKMSQNLHMQTATWLVSRELTEAAGDWDSTLAVDDDGEYFCRILLQSEGVRFVSEATVYYRASGSSSLSYMGLSDRKRDSQLRSMELHIQYLRSLEDSSRTRQASVQYLQNWLVFFYPERMDLVERMRKMAEELGGRLETPQLSSKYSWMTPVIGPRAAGRASVLLPRFKWAVLRFWDRMLHRLVERSKPRAVRPS